MTRVIDLTTLSGFDMTEHSAICKLESPRRLQEKTTLPLLVILIVDVAPTLSNTTKYIWSSFRDVSSRNVREGDFDLLNEPM